MILLSDSQQIKRLKKIGQQIYKEKQQAMKPKTKVNLQSNLTLKPVTKRDSKSKPLKVKLSEIAKKVSAINHCGILYQKSVEMSGQDKVSDK